MTVSSFPSKDDEQFDEDQPDDILDPATLGELTSFFDRGDQAGVLALIDVFVAEAEPRLRRLRDAATAGDLPGVIAIAHLLRGSSASLGAQLLADRCGELEVRGGRLGSRGVLDAVTEIEYEYQRARAALRARFA